jgi:MFS family permease
MTSPTPISKSVRFNLSQIFLLFGLGMMVTAARTPEIKANVGLDNATFGTFMTLGLLGSMAALLWMGDVVHKIGVHKVMLGAITVLYGGLAIVPHLHNGYIWLCINILVGFAISSFHISINAQAIHLQEQSGELLIPRLHGLWMVGSLSTSVIAILVTSRLSLSWHVDILVALVWLFSARAVTSLRPVLMGATPLADESKFSALYAIKQLPAAVRWMPWLAFGMMMAAQIEVAANDWTTIFAKEELGFSATIAIVPYLLFMISMIAIRFTVQRLFSVRPERYWLRRTPVVGGIGFIIFLQLSTGLSANHKGLGLLFGSLAFISAGLGCSYIVPGFFAIAARKSSQPGSVVIAQMSLINVFLTFLGKMVIAWVAGATSIGTALMIPGVMLIATTLSAHLGASEPTSSKSE